MNNRRMTLLATIAVLLVAASAGGAEGAVQGGPGSLLVFPHYEATNERETIVWLTNTNVDALPCGDRDAGEIAIRFQYFNGDNASEIFTRHETLLPGDTTGFIVSDHNLSYERGWLVVTAIDPDDWFRDVAFDWLVGRSMIVSSSGEAWDYSPYVFRSESATSDGCDLASTDADADGVADFDGVEYTEFPDRLVIDSFFEESGGRDNVISLMANASRWTAELDIVFLNNRGQRFTRSFNFNSWWSGELSDISGIAGSLSGDANEFAVQTGWVQLVGRRMFDGAGNPVLDRNGLPILSPILGLFAQSMAAGRVSFGGALFSDGTRDGLEVKPGNGT